MPTNIIAVYDQEAIAHQVMGDLMKSGCAKDDLTFVAPRESRIDEQLNAWGVNPQDAGTYSEAIRRAKRLVRARDSDDQADRVAGLLVQRGARRLADIQKELKDQPEVLKAAREELSVGKTEQTSQVSARLKVTEQPVEQTISLKEEKVHAESRPSDRPLSPEEADKAFQEGSIELSESREVPKVSKEAKVTQEVHLRKEAGERQETVRDTVRRSDIQIERKE